MDQIVKVIKFNNQEHSALHEVFNETRRMRKAMADIIEEMEDRRWSKEKIAWNIVAIKFGYKDFEDLKAAGYSMRLDLWDQSAKLIQERNTTIEPTDKPQDEK